MLKSIFIFRTWTLSLQRSGFPHSQDKRAGISKKFSVVLYPIFYIPCSTGEPASSATWEEVDSLIDARADHACEVIQYVHDDKNMVNNRHALPKGSDCPVLDSYQMWFCQKLLKNAKNNSQIVQIWQFL